MKTIMGTQWGRRLACGCALGYERCIDCRPGLHLDQEAALEITLSKLPDDGSESNAPGIALANCK